MKKVKYTGHPFVDVGIAVMESYLEKYCDDFTAQDFSRAAKWLINTYERRDIKGYLMFSHFPNSGWCNPNPKVKEKTKLKYIASVLESYKTLPLKPKRSCAFCNNEAQILADRRHIPLLTGTMVLVSAPNGVVGLPVCGYCLMAIQFYPLGTLKVKNRPLFWWTTSREMTFELVNDTFQEVRKALSITQEEIVNFQWPYTRLLSQAKDILERYNQNKQNNFLPDCIGYHITNNGKNPDYDQYFIPRELLEFWREIRIAPKAVREAHNWIEKSSWELPENKKKGGKQSVKSAKLLQSNGTKLLKNKYYEALGAAFQERDWNMAIRLRIVWFFLHPKEEHYDKNNFQLCELFFRKVGGMEKQRLDIIKKIADNIVDNLILNNNESKWVNDLFRNKMSSSDFMKYLVKAQRKLADLNHPIALADILTMFDIESDDETGLKDVYLIRHLFLIRMFERMGKKNKELLKSIPEELEDNHEEVG